VINVIGWVLKERGAIRPTRRRAAREGKKADDITIAHPADTQTLTPAVMTNASDILTPNGLSN
jgi:hypothetical protein